MPEYGPGFQPIADHLGEGMVGAPLEDESYFPNGQHSLQFTENGVFMYSKEGNKPHFLMGRVADEQEGALPSDYTPEYFAMPGNVGGTFKQMPEYCVLHGSRSGRPIPVDDEFRSVAAYATHEPNGLGWNISCGNDAIAEHLKPTQWGYHARACSPHSLSCEFAQPLESYIVTDGQVRAFCWWMREIIFLKWPGFRAKIMADPTHTLPTHAEVESWGWTGHRDGKSDVYSFGSEHTLDLRRRIVELL